MRYVKLFFVVTLCIRAGLSSAAVGNVERVELNGLWNFRLEAGKSLESVPMPAFEPNDKMPVPGCWDAMSRYYNRRGTGCYRTDFSLAADVAGARLVVDGFCLRVRAWLDGREIGYSPLPWSRVAFDVGALKAGRHELAAAVDSVVDPSKVKLFGNFYDFYAFGGFHHGVWLETRRNETALRRIVVRTRDFNAGLVELEAEFDGHAAPSDFSTTISFDGGDEKRVDFRNRRVRVNVPGFRLWSPATPHLHTVSVWPPDGRRTGVAPVVQRFGIRQVATSGGRITLNGKAIYLKGFNRHEAHVELGATTPLQLMYEDVQNVRDLGGNFIRGSHYPQNEAFLNLCDELGVMVWEESLGWGNGAQQLQDLEFRELQAEQTRLMVRNSINHPSVIISAFLNEPDSNLPCCRELVDHLIEVIRAEDSGHLVTFACHRNSSDISHCNTDIIAYNTYPCWYGYALNEGTPEEIRANIAKCHRDVVDYFRKQYRDDRPIVVSETGVKANYGERDPRGHGQYTEDFQAEYERIMLEEIFANREIAGIMIWQFTDAKTYTRVTPGMINRTFGVNTGGIYDLYRRPRLVVEEIRKLFGARKNSD